MLTCDELHIVSNAHDPICHFDSWSLLVYRVTSIKDIEDFQLQLIFNASDATDMQSSYDYQWYGSILINTDMQACKLYSNFD